jgi:glyoxylase-like metal-dependent hydrolase (beta-lactamase superfamily II)
LSNRGIEAADVAGAPVPGGIVPFQTARAAEAVYWLPDHRAVAVGDVLLGAGAKPRATDDALRLCPERWLGKATHEDLRVSLRPLLDLPVEHVLVSHGRPVVGNGKRELARVLG